MAYATLTRDVDEIITEKDNVIVRQVLNAKVGGAVLDTTGYTDKVIYAGSLVIYDAENDIYKVMPVNTGTKKVSTLPNGFSYFGVVIQSVPTSKPFVGIMTRGEVNYAAMEYSIADILTSVRNNLPHIIFTKD